MHRWASLTVTQSSDPVFHGHPWTLHEPEKQSGRDKTFLPRVEVEPGGGNPLFGTLAATVSMAGWAVVLWVVVSLFTFVLYGRWYLPMVANLG